MAATHTQDATAQQLAETFAAGFAARDLDQVTSCFTDDAIWTDSQLDRPLRGRDEIRDYCASMLGSVTDMTMTVDEIFTSVEEDQRLAVRWSMRGTLTGTFDGGGHAIIPGAPTGDRVHMKGVALMTLDGDRFARLENVMDQSDFQRQIGMMPAPGSAGAKAMAGVQRVQARLRRRRNAH